MASTYIYGNVVRKPDIYEDERREERRQSKERARRKVVSAARSREQGLSIDAPFVIVFFLAIVVSAFFIMNYLKLQADITATSKQIEAQQKTIEQMKLENDALEDSIDSYIDLQYVFDVATNELGMVYPTNDQVIRFEKTESGYVRQNEDILR